MKFGSRALLGLMAAALLWWAPALDAANVTELATKYQGKDREQKLLAEAKKEGKLVWYTSMAGTNYKALAKAFGEKYGIQVEAFRGSSKRLLPRVFGEAESGRHIFDVLETTPPTLMIVRDAKLLAPYTSPRLSTYPDVARHSAGKGVVYWATDRESYMSLTYNKKAVPAGAVPRGFGDLSNPALKGKIGLATTSSGKRAIGALIHIKGKEFADSLKSQGISLHAVSGRALLDMVVSGEVGVSFSTFRNHAVTAIAKGAPIEWLPLEVVVANAGGFAISRNAPHPHAALLMADFVLGPEGQKILQEHHNGSAWKDPGFKRWYPEAGMTREQYLNTEKRWNKTLTTIGRK